MSYQKWTEMEDARLRRLWEQGLTPGAIAETLNGRTAEGVLHRARRLQLKKRWGESERKVRIGSLTHSNIGNMDDTVRNAEMMRVGSEMMEMVLKGHMKAPEGLVWSIGSGGWSGFMKATLPPEENLVRVDSEPCPRCAARPGQCNHVNRGRLICA